MKKIIMADKEVFQKDLTLAVGTVFNTLSKQLWLELATIANSSSSFTEFQKNLVSKVVEIVKEYEDSGQVKKGTVDKLIKGEELSPEDIIKNNRSD